MWDFAKSDRGIFSLIAFAAVLLLAVALYMQHVLGLEPCNLCMFQRVFVVLAGSAALLAALHGPKGWGAKVYSVLVIVLSGLGAATAGRQLWLQSLPEDEIPACGPGLDYMLEAYPFLEMVEEVLRGSGDCAQVQWTFMGLSIPGWTMVCFVAAIVLALIVLLRKQTQSN